MANETRNAILRALIDGAVCELMVKTNVDNVYVSDNTTLASKLAEIITSLNNKATPEQVDAKVSAAVQELVDGAPAMYNTFKELADYISAHEDVADSLTAAIGNKADASTVSAIQATVNALGSLATKSVVTEADLDASLKEKVNAAAQGNHSHSNKTVLDGITSAKVTAWDGKANVYVSTDRPNNLTSNDLFIQLI